eukprot:1049225-Amphidinium_carterae.1
MVCWLLQRMLKLHHRERELKKNDCYWMCTFANNQHKLQEELVPGGALQDTPFLQLPSEQARTENSKAPVATVEASMSHNVATL